MKDLLPDLCDHYDKDIQLLPLSLHNYGSKTFFYGKAVTLRCFEDNSLVHDIFS